MGNVFRQFLLDAENGDVDAVKRNIENGIDLETRDEVRRTHSIKSCTQFSISLFCSGSTNGTDFISSV